MPPTAAARFRLAALVLLLAPLAGRAADADAVVRKAAADLYAGVRAETLPNGLRVYLKPIPGAPTVTTMLAYRVGSADEALDQTGLAHYLEHLMFKGTDKLMPGDIDRLTQRNGGRNNAYTTEDFTIYHFDFAADRWETALAIEADRMRNLRIDAKHEFEQEKGAVIAELKGNEDNPWDREYKAVLAPLFGKESPYGHPVIGEQKHVEAATAAVIKAYYDKWYQPNNAALVVCGGIDPDQALAKIKEAFQGVPRGLLPERRKAEPVTREKPARVEVVSQFDTPRLLLGFNTVRASDPDYYPLEVTEAVLSVGKTSRLYRRLVEDERIAAQVGVDNNAGRYPGWMSIQLDLLKDKDPAKAEALVLAELKRLADEPVGEAELNRVRRVLLANLIFARESVHDLADSIARGVMTRNLDALREYPEKVAAVTPADIQRVVRKYLAAERRVVVVSRPEKAAPPKEGKPAAPRRSARVSLGREATKGAGGSYDLTAAQRVVLPNGLTLLLLEHRRLPIVVAAALVKDVRLHEPEAQAGLATLTGNLLDEGTPDLTGPQIAIQIEDVGGSLSLSSSGGTLKVLSPDRSLGLRLFIDCLTRPVFPKDAFQKALDRQLSRIADDEQDPQERARRAYLGQVYGKNPLGRSPLGTEATVKALTPDECRKFHARVFVPNNTLLALVGDFDAKEVAAELTKLTENWKKTDLPAPKVPDPPAPEAKQRILSMPGAAQVHLYLGHLGIKRDDPDYYKLLVMDNVLGTGPGFTDRLSAALRDRQGLAYTVTATITPSAGEQVGTFTGYIGTYPDKFAVVKEGFLKEVNRLRGEAPKDEEVSFAKSYLVHSLPLTLANNERVADLLLTLERHGLGLDYLAKFRKAVEAVTPADVRAVAAKHLHPDQLTVVASGPIDAEGKPLKKR